MQTLKSNPVKSEPNLVDRVDGYLRQVISKVDTGNRLPSVRELMRECKVSQAVVDRTLTKLQAEGLVEGRPRSGFYRAEQNFTPSQLVNFLFFGDPGALEPGNFVNEFLGYLTAKLAQRSDSIRVRLMDAENEPEKVIEDIVHQKAKVFLTYTMDANRLYLVHDLGSRGVSCLHLFPNTQVGISPSLTVHDEKVVREQVEHLVKLGHRRIAYLHAATEDLYLRPANTRRDIFYKLCLEYKLDVEPEWVRYVGWDKENVRTQVHQLMTAPKKPTALIIYDQHVNPVYAGVRACGLVPGKDISVMGTDDMPWAAHVEPPLTSIRVPRIRAADTACEMMEELRAGKDPGMRYVETKMVVRGSTVKCA